MDKFLKRISKLKKRPQNAVVFGTGMGRLSDLATIFQSIFVFGSRPSIKAKNIIYRENFENLNQLSHVDMIFIDLNLKDQLNNLSPLWTSTDVIIVVEGDAVLDREYTHMLYSNNYRATERLGYFHTWTIQR